MAIGYVVIAIGTALACGVFVGQFGFYTGLAAAVLAGMTAPVLLVLIRALRFSRSERKPADIGMKTADPL